MGIISSFKHEKLVIPVLISDELLQFEVNRRLEAEFGQSDFQSKLSPFNFTDYYIPEMGNGIQRYFLAFKKLLSPELLAEIKILTNKIEESFAADSKRKVNLDPGFLSLSKFILASSKDYSHRIPLQKGIYAELTLQWKKSEGYSPLPWTYPDYAGKEYREILLKIREIYKKQLTELNQ